MAYPCIRSTALRSALFAAILGLAAACGDEPQRIGPSTPTATPTASPHPPIQAPATAASSTPRLGGRVRLAGSLAKAQSGAVFLIARSSGRTALVHKYDMNGPEWSSSGEERVLQFKLTDQDNMAGVGAPVGEKIELEARYDPEGFVPMGPGVEKKGAVRATALASIGDMAITITLKPEDSPAQPAAPAPPATPPGKPAGG